MAAFIPVVDFFALLATLVWIVVTSVVLARTKREPAYVAAPGPAWRRDAIGEDEAA